MPCWISVYGTRNLSYLAGDPFYHRIRPDKVNGMQPPDVHAEKPLHNGILPLRRRVGYVFDEHSGPLVPSSDSFSSKSALGFRQLAPFLSRRYFEWMNYAEGLPS